MQLRHVKTGLFWKAFCLLVCLVSANLPAEEPAPINLKTELFKRIHEKQIPPADDFQAKALRLPTQERLEILEQLYFHEEGKYDEVFWGIVRKSILVNEKFEVPFSKSLQKWIELYGIKGPMIIVAPPNWIEEFKKPQWRESIQKGLKNKPTHGHFILADSIDREATVSFALKWLSEALSQMPPKLPSADIVKYLTHYPLTLKRLASTHEKEWAAIKLVAQQSLTAPKQDNEFFGNRLLSLLLPLLFHSQTCSAQELLTFARSNPLFDSNSNEILLRLGNEEEKKSAFENLNILSLDAMGSSSFFPWLEELRKREPRRWHEQLALKDKQSDRILQLTFEEISANPNAIEPLLEIIFSDQATKDQRIEFEKAFFEFIPLEWKRDLTWKHDGKTAEKVARYLTEKKPVDGVGGYFLDGIKTSRYANQLSPVKTKVNPNFKETELCDRVCDLAEKLSDLKDLKLPSWSKQNKENPPVLAQKAALTHLNLLFWIKTRKICDSNKRNLYTIAQQILSDADPINDQLRGHEGNSKAPIPPYETYSIYAKIFRLLILEEIQGAKLSWSNAERKKLEALVAKEKNSLMDPIAQYRKIPTEFGGEAYLGVSTSSLMNNFTLSSTLSALKGGGNAGAPAMDQIRSGLSENGLIPYTSASPTAPTIRGATPRSVLASLLVYRNARSASERKSYRPILLDNLRRFTNMVEEYALHATRDNTHIGKDGIAPYYYWGNMPYASAAIRLLLKDGPNSDEQNELEEMRKTMAASLMSRMNKDGIFYTMDNHSYPDSLHYIDALGGLALLPLINECQNRKIDPSTGILSPPQDENLPFTTSPLSYPFPLIAGGMHLWEVMEQLMGNGDKPWVGKSDFIIEGFLHLLKPLLFYSAGTATLDKMRRHSLDMDSAEYHRHLKNAGAKEKAKTLRIIFRNPHILDTESFSFGEATDVKFLIPESPQKLAEALNELKDSGFERIEIIGQLDSKGLSLSTTTSITPAELAALTLSNKELIAPNADLIFYTPESFDKEVHQELLKKWGELILPKGGNVYAPSKRITWWLDKQGEYQVVTGYTPGAFAHLLGTGNIVNGARLLHHRRHLSEKAKGLRMHSICGAITETAAE